MAPTSDDADNAYTEEEKEACEDENGDCEGKNVGVGEATGVPVKGGEVGRTVGPGHHAQLGDGKGQTFACRLAKHTLGSRSKKAYYSTLTKVMHIMFLTLDTVRAPNLGQAFKF